MEHINIPLPQDAKKWEADMAIKEWSDRYDRRFKGGGLDEEMKARAEGKVTVEGTEGEKKKERKAGRDSKQPMMKAKGIKLAYVIHMEDQVGFSRTKGH